MNLELVATLGARLSRMADRLEAGEAASRGVAQAFDADAVVIWLPRETGACRPADLFTAGTLVPPGALEEIAAALTGGVLNSWLTSRGAVVGRSASLDGQGGPSGLLAVGWRRPPAADVPVDSFLTLISSQLRAVAWREALQQELVAQRKASREELRSAQDRMRAQLSGQLRLSQRASALLELARRLAAESDTDTIYGVVLDSIERQVDGARALVANCDGSGPAFSVRMAGGRAAGLRHVQALREGAAAGFGAEVVGSGSATSVLLDRAYPLDAALLEDGIRAVTAVPIAIGSRPQPVLLVGWPDARECPPEDLWFLENLGVQVALALRNARLYSDFRQSMLALQDARKEALLAQRLRALADLTAGVAHQFNNALTSILGLADWLLLTLPPDAEGRPEIEKIRGTATEVANLVERLREFARVRAGAEVREEVDPVEALRSVPDIIRPRMDEASRRCGVEYDLLLDLAPAPLVRFVPSELREVLVHLATNAIEAMPDGGRLVLRSACDDNRVRLSVSDQGGGLPPEARARLFEPFFTTKGGDNMGLGLSVCRAIAERHGATIEVSDEPGIGSTFTLVVPARLAGSTCGDPVPAPRETADRAGDRLRVLLVDDQADVLDAMVEMVAAFGHQVDTAAGGAQALELLGRRPFDLLLTDLAMPDMDGRELARRAVAAQPALRVVLLTGWSGDTEAAPPPHVSGVLAKPVTMKALHALLARDTAAAGAA